MFRVGLWDVQDYWHWFNPNNVSLPSNGFQTGILGDLGLLREYPMVNHSLHGEIKLGSPFPAELQQLCIYLFYVLGLC